MKNQNGFSIFKLIIYLCVGIFVAVNAMRIVPVYLEFNHLKKIFDQVSNNGTLVGAGKREIKKALDSQLDAAKIKIDESQIEISIDENKRPVLSASYDKSVRLFGNASWLIHFDTATASSTSNPLAGATAAKDQINSVLKEQDSTLKNMEK